MTVSNYTLANQSSFNAADKLVWIDVVIPSGADGLSDTVTTKGLTLEVIVMPAAWQTADITFLGGKTVAGLKSLYFAVDNSTAIAEVTVKTPVASKTIQVDPKYFEGCEVLQLRSGTSSAAVDQTTNRTLTLGFRAR